MLHENWLLKKIFALAKVGLYQLKRKKIGDVKIILKRIRDLTAKEKTS